jgi:hypothetical protein
VFIHKKLGTGEEYMKRSCTAMGFATMLLFAVLLVLLIAAVFAPPVLTWVRYLALFTLAAIVLTSICIAISS